MYARITTDANGKIGADSTCTVAGTTSPVPAKGITRAAPHRIWAALTAAGVKPATDYYSDITNGDGYVDIAVVPAA